jgi:hypothetical protein
MNFFELGIPYQPVINGRIMSWPKGATQGSVFAGGNGNGDKPNQLLFPNGLACNRHGHLYVADMGNRRVQRFKIYQNASC